MKAADKKFLVIIIAILNASHVFTQFRNPKTSDLVETMMDEIEPPIPLVYPLFPYHLRDVAVCKGGDQNYYLTGTTDDNWGVAGGIRVWKSKDLEDWTLMGDDGFVWTFDRDASNNLQKEIVNKKERLVRGIWAPEIHYLKNNYWITYSVSNGYGSGLLRSTSGKPEGPYVDVDPDKGMVEGIDATLFQDDDGSVWYIWGPGKMKKLKDDMTGFQDNKEPAFPKDAAGNEVGYEGVNIYKNNGIYYLMAAQWNSEGPNLGHFMRSTDLNRRAADGRYDCMVAMSDRLTGPYSKAYIALAHGGHNMIFDDFQGRIWASMFGNDEAAAPFREYPALVQMKINESRHLEPIIPLPFKADQSMPVIYVSPEGKKSDGKSWETAYTSLQEAIDAAVTKTQIWISGGDYIGGFRIENVRGLYIYGGFAGNEKRITERETDLSRTVLDGEGNAAHVLQIRSAEYLRIDGVTIRGGNAYGDDEMGCGAGIFLEGGGETVRFSNCLIRDNFAIRNGGGIYATRGASPCFTGCEFINNEARENGGAAFVDCNEANGYHTRFYHCNIESNKAQMNGGAVFFSTNLKQTGTLRFINCLIRDNFTLLEAGNIVMNGGATLLMSHCTVTGNKGMSKGTVIATLGRIPAQNRIVNSIFTGNYGAILFTSDAYQGTDPTSSRMQDWTRILHCLFYNNQTQGICGYTHNSQRFTTVSQVNASTWAAGNIDADPLFVDPAAGNYLLQPASPAIGSGTPDNAFPADIEGQIRTIEMNTLITNIDLGFDQFVK